MCARKLLGRVRILLWGDANTCITAFSVDLQTDALMQEIIRTDFKDSTIVAIAHRLETIRDFDRVIVLEAGRMVECGEPGELLQRDSRFKEMWEMGRRTRDSGRASDQRRGSN